MTPCKQFSEQTPDSDKAILSFCTLCYVGTFPRFAKIEVSGKNTSLCKRLTENTSLDGFDKLHPLGILMTQLHKKQTRTL